MGLSGYLPRGKKIREARGKFVVGDGMKLFLARGTKDMLVPLRVFRDTKARVEGTTGGEVVECHEYEGLSHACSGMELRDLCSFLERVVPE